MPCLLSFHETHDVRVQVLNGQPWFCLADVCAKAGIQNPRDLLSKQLDKAGVEKIYVSSQAEKAGQLRQRAKPLPRDFPQQQTRGQAVSRLGV